MHRVFWGSSRWWNPVAINAPKPTGEDVFRKRMSCVKECPYSGGLSRVRDQKNLLSCEYTVNSDFSPFFSSTHSCLRLPSCGVAQAPIRQGQIWYSLGLNPNIPSYNHDRIKVDNDRPDHLYSARIHHRKSLDARRIVARSYFWSLQSKLDAPLEGTEQGPEGQGCWYEVEPEYVESQQENVSSRNALILTVCMVYCMCHALFCSAMSCCDIRFIKLAMGVSSLIEARFMFLLL